MKFYSTGGVISHSMATVVPNPTSRRTTVVCTNRFWSIERGNCPEGLLKCFSADGSTNRVTSFQSIDPGPQTTHACTADLHKRVRFFPNYGYCLAPTGHPATSPCRLCRASVQTKYWLLSVRLTLRYDEAVSGLKAQHCFCLAYEKLIECIILSHTRHVVKTRKVWFAFCEQEEQKWMKDDMTVYSKYPNIRIFNI